MLAASVVRTALAQRGLLGPAARHGALAASCTPRARALRAVPALTRGHATRGATSSPPHLKIVRRDANFAQLCEPSTFRVDKARFLRVLEDTTRHAALLRPEGWGKSSFLQLMENYYDFATKGSPLVSIPGGATPLAHSFTVLRVDMADVGCDVGSEASESEVRHATQAALDGAVRQALSVLAERHNFTPDLDMAAPVDDLLQQVALQASRRRIPLYMLVDNYDAPLRNLAMADGDASSALAGHVGPLCRFFGRIKRLHGQHLMPRSLITGALLVLGRGGCCTTACSEC